MSSEPAPATPTPPSPEAPEGSPTHKTIDAGMYLEMGCLVISVVVVFLAALIFFSGYRMLQHNADPATRLTVAQDILVTPKLPEGLHPALAMAMPDALQMVVLTDDPAVMEPGAEATFTESGLAIFRILSNPKTTQGDFIENFLEGRQETEEIDAMMPAMLDGTSISHGTLSATHALAQFNVQRGTLQVFGSRGKGVVNRFVLQCNGGGQPVFGVWFMREEIYSETPKVADTDALSKMLQPMKICGAPG